MSHFSVLVIGDDVEGQLAPFDENIEMPRRRDGEVSDEEKVRFLGYYVNGDDGEDLPEEELTTKLAIKGFFDAVYDENGGDWNNNDWKKDVNGIWFNYTTYNPNSKWDWYQEGGRYAGQLILKPEFVGMEHIEPSNPSLLFKAETQAQMISNETVTDSALVKEIDWDAMDAKRLKSSNDRYDAFLADGEKNGFKNAMGYFKFGVSGVEVSEEEFAREIENPLYYRTNSEKPCRHQNREEYVGGGAFGTFALLMDGEWYERGEMGWWAHVSNEMDTDKWDELFQDKIKSLDPETRITMIDCHI